MTSAGTGKIWILVPDWSRVKSLEPNAGDVTRKIGSLYFKTLLVTILSKKLKDYSIPRKFFDKMVNKRDPLKIINLF